MNNIVSLFFRMMWFPISILEKFYWVSWRASQKAKFKSCGKNVFIGRHSHFTHKNIIIHDDVYIGRGCCFQAIKSNIIIGKHVMFGPNVSIHGGNHRTDLVGRLMKDISIFEKLPKNDMDVIIEDDVWIGARALILKGVHIGQGSVIGAGSIVTKDVPPYHILVGSPSQKLYPRWTDEQIEEHKKIITKEHSNL